VSREAEEEVADPGRHVVDVREAAHGKKKGRRGQME